MQLRIAEVESARENTAKLKESTILTSSHTEWVRCVCQFEAGGTDSADCLASFCIQVFRAWACYLYDTKQNSIIVVCWFAIDNNNNSRYNSTELTEAVIRLIWESNTNAGVVATPIYEPSSRTITSIAFAICKIPISSSTSKTGVVRLCANFGGVGIYARFDEKSINAWSTIFLSSHVTHLWRLCKSLPRRLRSQREEANRKLELPCPTSRAWESIKRQKPLHQSKDAINLGSPDILAHSLMGYGCHEAENFGCQR